MNKPHFKQAKIALSEQDKQSINLDDITDGLSAEVTKETLRLANNRTLESIGELMKSAVDQAQCQPEVIFVTGGTAKSPVLSEFIQAQMPNIPIIVGDHFGSVTSGLARWADKVFK